MAAGAAREDIHRCCRREVGGRTGEVARKSTERTGEEKTIKEQEGAGAGGKHPEVFNLTRNSPPISLSELPRGMMIETIESGPARITG